VDRCLSSADKEQVRFRSIVDQVWEYLDQAYLRQDAFLHDLMKAEHAVNYVSDKNYRLLEEYLDLL
jgi:hypothetical protein